MTIEDLKKIYDEGKISLSDIQLFFPKLLDGAHEHKDLLEDLADLGITHDNYGYSLEELESNPILS